MHSLLAQTRQDFWMILPEVQLALWGLGILLTDFLLVKEQKWVNAVTAMFGVVFSGYAMWILHYGAKDGRTGFRGSIVIDPFFIFFGFIFLATTALVILLSVRYLEI